MHSLRGFFLVHCAIHIWCLICIEMNASSGADMLKGITEITSHSSEKLCSYSVIQNHLLRSVTYGINTFLPRKYVSLVFYVTI
jgi:hypothetical protein